jgi:hypothetical protein
MILSTFCFAWFSNSRSTCVSFRPTAANSVMGAADYWAKGTWRHEKEQVILNSDGKKEAPFKFLRSEVGKPGRIRVWVKGENGQGAEHINVVLQAGAQHFEAATTSEGAAEFPDVAGASAVFF